MGNPNPKNQIKSSEQAREMGKKSKRGISLKSSLLKIFREEIAAGDKGKLTPDNFVKTVIVNSMKGNSGMAKMIFEYIDGKPTENIKLEAEVKENIDLSKLTTNELKTLKRLQTKCKPK